MTSYDHYGRCFECGKLTGLNVNTLMCDEHDYMRQITELKSDLTTAKINLMACDNARLKAIKANEILRNALRTIKHTECDTYKVAARALADTTEVNKDGE